MIFKQGQNETLAEKIERAKATRKRAMEVLAKPPAYTRSSSSNSKPKLLTDQTKRARELQANKEAKLKAKIAVDRMMNPLVAKLNKPPGREGYWQGKPIGLMWRGQLIPTSKWRDPK